MCPSPYRTAEDRPRDPPDPVACPDTELLPVFVIVWLCSLVRVGFGLETGEIFGTELTLAALLILALPLFVRDALASLVPRRRRSPDR